MNEDPDREERVTLPPVIVVARDANRRQALVALATRAGLEVVGAYPAWPGPFPATAILLTDGAGAAGLDDMPAVVAGGRRTPGMEGAPRAYLSALPPPEQLAAAVLAVHAGLSAFAGGSLARDVAATEELTARERDVLAGLARGESNRAIALALGIRENTVKFHVAAILAKLGAQSRAEAVMAAVRRGLLPL